jgi:metal-sulfur cluster biosynthetic enzyme
MPEETLPLTKEMVYQRLGSVMDPELNVDLVSLGLIYEVTVKDVQVKSGTEQRVHVLMTLTTPGSPLAGMFDQLIKEALVFPGFDPQQQVTTELTFDPPWLPAMMTDEARAELGLD